MLILEDVPWDSDFFGYKVGKISLNASSTSSLESLLRENTAYRLIYIFVDRELTESLPNCILADRKLLLHQPIAPTISGHHTDIVIVPFDAKNDSYEELKQLALLSGIFSRFNTDKSFTENEYKKLYSQWIYGNVYNHTAFCILVAKQGKRITGFITLEKKTTALCTIGLIAVSPSAQGEGIGHALVLEAINKAHSHGFSEIQVVTQAVNTAALRLYLKTGFTLTATTFIYHYRNV